MVGHFGIGGQNSGPGLCRGPSSDPDQDVEKELVRLRASVLTRVTHILANICICKFLKENYTALHVAVQAEKYEIVEILIGSGADVSIKGGPLAETALHVAAGLNNKGGQHCAEMLIKSGADVNSKLEVKLSYIYFFSDFSSELFTELQ